MDAIRIIEATSETVTIARADFEALLQAAEDAEDVPALAAHDVEGARIGKAKARRDDLTVEEIERLLAGENPVRLWRQKRGLSQRALAAAAGMQPGYLAEIETGRQPGSVDAYQRLSAALDVPVHPLLPNPA